MDTPSIPRSEHFGSRVYALLNRPNKAKSQTRDGYTDAYGITLGYFENHLIDGDCLALMCCHGGLAKFVCWDIDWAFEARLIVVKQVLADHGFQRAAFAINGSSTGRGKVVLTFVTPVDQDAARILADDLLAEFASDARFGSFVKGRDVSVYPTRGDGSGVRLFGRNRLRFAHGLGEAPLDLDGDLSDLYYVEPISIEPISIESPPEPSATPAVRVPRVGKSALSAWASNFVAEPYTGSTVELFKCQVRLGHEVAAVFGDAARERLAEFFSTIAANSPSLSASSQRSLSRSDVIETVLRYASKSAGKPVAEALADGWAPLDLEKENHTYPEVYGSQKRLPRGAMTIYTTLTAYILEHRLDPHCFAIDFKRMAEYCGFNSKDTVFKALTAAQEAGILFRVDHGTSALGGLPTMLTFVGQGETLQDAYDAALATEALRQRVKHRTDHNLPSSRFVVHNNRVARRPEPVALRKGNRAGGRRATHHVTRSKGPQGRARVRH
jgi:hypothetical protein